MSAVVVAPVHDDVVARRCKRWGQYPDEGFETAVRARVSARSKNRNLQRRLFALSRYTVNAPARAPFIAARVQPHPRSGALRTSAAAPTATRRSDAAVQITTRAA